MRADRVYRDRLRSYNTHKHTQIHDTLEEYFVSRKDKTGKYRAENCSWLVSVCFILYFVFLFFFCATY